MEHKTLSKDDLIEIGVRAAIAADSGPENSILFDIHWNEFADSYRTTLQIALDAMAEANARGAA